MRGEIEAVRLFGDKLAIPERVIPTLPAEPMVGSVEVARRLGRSRRWVALELERGHMRGYKTSECGKYRIPESEIARYLELWANEAKQATRKRTPQRKSNLNARPGVHRQRTVRVFG
jgi:excisionase family DNA binding protein